MFVLHKHTFWNPIRTICESALKLQLNFITAEMSRHKDPESIIDMHLIASVVTDLVLCGAWSNVPHTIFKVERHVDLLT